MKAAVIREPGTPDVLRIEEIPLPQPTAGWVLIRVKAFGLNRSELFTRQGHSLGVEFPRVLGIEAVGTVEEAPGGEFQPGQTVATAMGGMGRAFGDPQVRNRGTLGGSLAHVDPAADYPAVMLAVDAEIHLRSSQGPCVVLASDFFQDLFTVDPAPDEIITAVRFAPVRTAAYAKLYQRASRFAIVGVAAALDVADGVIRSARVGLTGAVSHVVRLTAVEEALAGRQPTPEVVAEAAQLAGSDLEDVAGDIHASETYRRAMVPVFAKRALDVALARLT